MPKYKGIDLASIDELKEFCNAVRYAGGGNPLDALLPAIPQEPEECLIARNLNFSCTVDGNAINYFADTIPDERIEALGYPEGYQSVWCMNLENRDIANKIANALALPIMASVYDEGIYVILLPARIGLIAQVFDNWEEDEDWQNHWLNDYVEQTEKDRREELVYS